MPKPDVLYTPNFIFRASGEHGQISVCQLDDMMHLAHGALAVMIPLEVWNQLTLAWSRRPGAPEECPRCHEMTTGGLYTSEAGITHCGCYEHDEEFDDLYPPCSDHGDAE
jgi:hypothetical protein